MKKAAYKIPFSKRTDCMMAWVWYLDDPGVDWKDNYVFEDDLEYVRPAKGSSSRSVLLKSLRDGRSYNMFWTYFDQCIRRDNNSPGPVFHGKWTFIKTGNHYSVKPVQEDQVVAYNRDVSK